MYIMYWPYTALPSVGVSFCTPDRQKNGIRNIMEDQYPPIYLSIILKSYLARKRRLADGDTKRKLADTQITDTETLGLICV